MAYRREIFQQLSNLSKVAAAGRLSLGTPGYQAAPDAMVRPLKARQET